MRLSEVGEFGLIRRLQDICNPRDGRVILGIGDDAAVIRQGESGRLILTTDAMAEGVHFDRAWFPAGSLGWKCLAVNLSDVAAMGGSPVCCVVTAALPENWSVEDVEALYAGIKRCGDRYGCPIVGGDTVRTAGGAVFSVAVLGEIPAGKEIRRSGALVGDRICVTGELGGASVGLDVLRSGEKDKALFPESVRRFLEPLPRMEEAVILARSGGVTSMIDISDGLASEIRHLCSNSGLGAVLYADRIPVSAETVRRASAAGESPVRRALESGEEYELLFTVNLSASAFPAVCLQTEGIESIGPAQRGRGGSERISDISSLQIEDSPPLAAGSFNPAALPERAGACFSGLHEPVTVIGKMMPLDAGIRIREGGDDSPLAAGGWDHYRSASGKP